MTQIELNELLCEAVTAKELDIVLVEDLLKEGADPLGPYNQYYDYTLNKLFVEAQERERAERLPILVGLFLQYGMDIETSEWDVLHELTWIRNETGIQTLKLFLDAGLSASLAESFAVELIGDILMFEAGAYDTSTPFRDNTWDYSIDYAIKMILLLASYEHVFSSSRYLRELVCAEEEGADHFLCFRNWNDYLCVFAFFESDTRTTSGEKIRTFQGKATAIEKGSNTEIHKLRLIGYLDMDNLPCRKCDCGGDPETVMVVGNDFAVRCDKCHISTRAFMTPEEAAMHWNRGDVSMPPLDLITDDLEGNLSGKVLYMDISHEDVQQYNRQSCECYNVMIVYTDRIIMAEHIENGENGAISVIKISRYNEELYNLRIKAPANGEFELIKILYAEDGTVDCLKYRYGERYLFVFAAEYNLIVTKSLCDLTEEDDTPIPEIELSVLFD